MKKIDEKILEVESYIKKHLSKERYEHSVRVAKYALFLASLSKKTKKLKELAYFTGLAHDICKELPDKDQLKLAKKDGSPITEIEMQNMNLLHGRAGAVFLHEKFGVDNKKVLDAIKHHTFGSPELKKLGKLLFIADKIEPGRKGSEAENFRKMATNVSIDMLALNILDFNINKLSLKNLKAADATIAMQHKLRKKIKAKK